MADEGFLSRREVGQFDLSVGTSLALEGAFGIYPEREESPAPIYGGYNALWVNLSTLFRNLMNSFSTDDQARVDADTLVQGFSSDAPMLEGIIRERLGQSMKVVFYYVDTSPKRLQKLWPKANVKFPTTDKQRAYAALHDKTIAASSDAFEGLDVRTFKGALSGEGNALIMTHMPMDLLSRPHFDELTLLESHTGKFKPRKLWGSKLGNRDDTIPFNGFTMQVFGDQSTLFSPTPIKYRKAVENLAKRDRWTPLTTSEKMRAGLNTIKDDEIRQHLLEIFNHRSFQT